ncbi:MAG: hypothetical protein FD135_2071 [Comamonadaceae bacterium]|nr:MAG: hypothetical protein FD135_2071 [Comamonadaceae bacterium]
MSISEQTLSALQQLMAQDKTLLAQVQASSHTAQAANLIADAATKAGIEVKLADLTAHFANAAQTATGQALSDQQLEAVAGGFKIGDDAAMILLSIVSFGLTCAVVSITHAASKEKLGFEKKYC